jgi:hypothetical protein
MRTFDSFGIRSVGVCWILMVYDRGAQIFQKSRSHLKILGARRVTWSKFRTEDPQILGATVQNLVARDFCTPGLCSVD